MYSGKLAAQLVNGCVATGDPGTTRLPVYERRVNRSMSTYWQLVEAFYTTPFMELFLQPRNKFNLPSAVTALLAGELEGGWKIFWRMRLFFWLIKLQARWSLVPRICWDESHGRSEPAPESIGSVEAV
jgi:FADH2-dependent halogenase